MRSSHLVRETLQYFVEDVGAERRGLCYHCRLQGAVWLLCSNRANEFTVCPFEPYKVLNV